MRRWDRTVDRTPIAIAVLLVSGAIGVLLAPATGDRAPGIPSAIRGLAGSHPLASSGGGGGLAGPAIASFTAIPPSVPVGSAMTFHTNASGGSAPLHYAYTGLPPGCSTQNSSTLVCVPNTAGKDNVTVTVTDTSGEAAIAGVKVEVTPAPTTTLALFGLTGAAALLGLGVIVILAGTGIVAVLRWNQGRKKRNDRSRRGQETPSTTS